MKPTFSIADEKVIMENCQDLKVKPSNRKWPIRAAIILTSVVVIAGLVFGAVYFGMFLTKEHIKETWVQYHDTAGRLVNQKITVTLTEEDYETNTMRAIYDFDNMLITYKFVSDNAGNCYVSKLNQSEVDPPAKVYSNLTEGWITDNMAPRLKQMQLTTIEVPREMLSPRAMDMCKFSNVYWMLVHDASAATNGTHVQKRAAAGMMDMSLEGGHCCCTCGSCCSCQMSSGSMQMA